MHSVGEASWVPAGTLRLGRSQTRVARLGADRVLVVGSDNVCTPEVAWDESVSTEEWDPQAGSWLTTGSLPKPRDRFVLAALLDGRALVIGGTTADDVDGLRSYSSTYVFDPTFDSWSRSGLMNTARSDPSGAVLTDGRVLVAGGYYADLPANPPLRMLDSSELFDPSTGEWSRTGALAQARYGASAVTLADGRVLIVGGSVEGGNLPFFGDGFPPLASSEVYDPTTGRWDPAGELSIARHAFVLVALADGGALVAGGRALGLETEFGYGLEPTSSTERFDPNTGVWSPAADMVSVAADRIGISLADGRVLVAGGDITVDEVDLDLTPPGLTVDAEMYDPESGVWEATTPLPRPRSGASAVLLDDGSVLIVGGIIAFAPPGDTPSCPAPDSQALRYVPGS